MNDTKVLGNKNTRNIALDIIRALAALLVVMIHCSAIFLTDHNGSTLSFVLGNIFDGLSRPGVALFLMISGALMLNEERERSLGDMLKAAKGVVILIVLWSVIYSLVFNVVFNFLEGEAIVLSTIVKACINGHFHMWYLYMLVGLYVTTPFLRTFVKKENKKLVLLYIFIALCTTFIEPLVNTASLYFKALLYINTFIKKFNFGFFGGYIAYYLTGWYIVHVGIDQKWMRNVIYILGAISAVLIVGIVQITNDYQNVYSVTGILVFFYSVSIFLAINNIKEQHVSKCSKVAVLLSKLSFGIYIIHPMINTPTGKILRLYIDNPLIQLPLKFIIVTTISIVVSYLLSKTPVLKKLIRT